MKTPSITATRLLLLVVAAATLAGCGDVVGGVYPGPVTWVSRPIWSPNGERIVFGLKGEEGPGGVYIVDADGGGLQRLRDVATDSPDWHMAHRVLKGASDGERAGVARLRRVGVRTTGRWPGGAPKELVFFVAWSPDRQQIAYSYRSPGRTDQDVHVVRADGRSKPRLVARHANSPTWSPDGRLLAVSRGLKGIFVVPASGGRPRRLPIEVEGIGLYYVAWSPEGNRIAYATTDALYVAEVAGDNVRRVADVDDA